MKIDEKVLRVDEKQKTSYCIPPWLRDEQIKQNLTLVKERIQHVYELRSDPIAVVCYGPSLADTWEKIRDFKYVIAASGAHKFLIDRGIIPTFHTEVDPRPHKVHCIGTPHKDVEYLIASACHRSVFEHLKGFNVKLWHIFDGAEEGLRVLPHGEWALTGGCGCGLRALVLARFLGFREQHVFGMDGNVREGDQTHAADHPNKPPYFFRCEYGGRTWFTTPGYLEAARNTPYELDQMPDVNVTFYGDGLVQTLMREHVKQKAACPIIAQKKPELISSEYRELNAQLHRDNLAYGVGGGKRAKVVLELAKSLETTSILDFGCGKGYLAKEIPFPIWEYDPAIPGKDESPRAADLVVCTDVLEHVEPDKIVHVIDELARVTIKCGYFVIHTGPAVKKYANGQNTHLLQQDKQWWKIKLEQRFQIAKIFEKGPELHFVVGPKSKKRKTTMHVVTGEVPASV